MQNFSSNLNTHSINQYVQHLKQSAIRATSIRCNELGGVNLGQGVCEIPVHPNIQEAAKEAIAQNRSIYSHHQGVPALRAKLLEKIRNFNHVPLNSEAEILVSLGATGAYVAAAKTLFNRGDEVILFEPFYGYHRGILELFDLNVKTIPIDLTTNVIDFEQLKASITIKTKAIVLCTPCNPSGKIFTKDELLNIGRIAKENNLFIITDEMYEYFTYDEQHISIASLEDFFERTLTISGFSKTYNVTGWRLGYAYGSAWLIERMALVHDLFYVCPPTPLQYAMIAALELPQSYYQNLTHEFKQKREYMCTELKRLGFDLTIPKGAYYLMVNVKSRDFKNDEEAAQFLLEQAKVATVMGRAFYKNPKDGANYVRICFAMDNAKLTRAIKQMSETFKTMSNVEFV